VISQPLSDLEIKDFWENGYLCLEDAISQDQLAAVRSDFDDWLEESKNHSDPFGITIDGRPRFDLQPGHSSENPALRRVSSPIEVSDACLDVMRNSRAVDAIAQLIGPNVEFNNSKVNFKQPGTSTKVDFHQDFVFQPHSNDDLIAVLISVDEMTLENGPLQVVPGSHRGPIFEHWHDGVFTGAVSKEVMEEFGSESINIVAKPGTACFMHGRLLHGSAPNLSTGPRTLLINEYRSEDAKPLDKNHIPSEMEGELVRGVVTNRVRSSDFEMAFPEYPTTASFFDQQAKSSAGM